LENIAVIPRRLNVIQRHKATGGLIAAVMPIHYPRALFRAFDILPVEVWGPPGIDASKGTAHLQPYICSIVHSALAFLKSGGLNIADILVVPHACDSLQGLGSILIDFVRPPQPVIPIYLPRGRRNSDLSFFAQELRSIFDRFKQLTGQNPSMEALEQHIQLDEEADAELAKLHEHRDFLPGSDLDFYRLVRSREYLPSEEFIDLAEGALKTVADKSRVGTPIVLSGIVPEPMAMLAMITEIGGRVVADDLACCGRRLYPRGREKDPFVRMAERILVAPPDPTRGNAIQERRDHLLRLVDKTAAKGVVFYEIKFCEPELFDLPLLRRELDNAGVPTMVVEVDINDPISHQIRTRLEAFMEMLA
jgi:benzoyl-CoA reductase/2-hydroxyglutaryl-CoA dehydratase subunit BcrC/BadD/HgdB